MVTPVGRDFSLALYLVKDAAIFFFSESDIFLENKENVTASSVKYNKCQLNVKPQGSNFLYMFRDCDTFSSVSDYKECDRIILIVLRELFSGS
ncbi:hypothetical protein AVEN_30733-1 [Araneus ventricosus]|uniref:Uncharacterized protein n=1 Tax=Araneus ventricosus TaxID=182803 RepID=A0A4Y2PKT9_ARAVE|nr:hypothetical protein AVEN_30733-1 [Araneus ventricosus]